MHFSATKQRRQLINKLTSHLQLKKVIFFLLKQEHETKQNQTTKKNPESTDSRTVNL